MANDRLSESHGQKQTVRSANAPRRFARLVKPHLHVTHNKLVVAQSLLPPHWTRNANFYISIDDRFRTHSAEGKYHRSGRWRSARFFDVQA